MKWKVADSPGTSGIDEVAVDLRTAYTVDDDGHFETPDDLERSVQRRLEEAGHKPVATDASEDEDDGATDDDVEDAVDELEEDDETVDDEYSDMDRSELYELYKEEGGPESWNDTDADFLRRSLRVHDEHGTFPTLEETDT